MLELIGCVIGKPSALRKELGARRFCDFGIELSEAKTEPEATCCRSAIEKASRSKTKLGASRSVREISDPKTEIGASHIVLGDRRPNLRRVLRMTI
jgi:hypothetical protein